MSSTSNIVSSMLRKLYPWRKEDWRALVVGNDASGKTTILYKLKLGEIITTIPTIGFNVETLEYKNASLTVWDVGGCDKIRPLWRHYYQNCHILIFVIDSNDHDRLVSPRDSSGTRDKYAIYTNTGIELLLEEEELKDAILLLYANKQDLPNAFSVKDLTTRMDLLQVFAKDTERWGRERPIHIQACCGITGEGLYEGLNWLIDSMNNPSEHWKIIKTENENTIIASSSKPMLSPADEEAQRLDALLVDWLTREDLPEDIFLQQLEDATLDVWDHYTHLRIAWLLLTRHGRREGMTRIFTTIKSFIERSPRTKRSDTSRGTTFHETMTYFWVHMVHYAMVATRNLDGSFKTFLLMNPQLVNGGLFLHFYSKQLMLLNPEARSTVLLPDKRPLPSLITHNQHQQQQHYSSDNLLTSATTISNSMTASSSSSSSNITPLHLRFQPRLPLTDEEFITTFNQSSTSSILQGHTPTLSHSTIDSSPLLLLPSWGHDARIRLIYLLLLENIRLGKRRDVDIVLNSLRSIEKDSFHMTINYFWIQMVTYFNTLVQQRLNKENKPPLDISTTTTTNTTTTATNTATNTILFNNKIVLMDFEQWYRQPECQKLRNQLLYEKYYSASIIDSSNAAIEFVLPNIKNLPSVILS